MSIKSKLEEAVGSLLEAKMMAERIPDEALVKAIGHGISALLAPIALADPGKAWLEETDAAWGVFGTGPLSASRFAAKISVGELRKYGDRCGVTDRPEITKQIADLDAIANGGGE